jgi:CDP-diacylglycerol--serine O-phosphatidyltransferase
MVDRKPRRRLRSRLNKNGYRLRHGLSILPSLFTVGNIFCGYYAVLSSLRGNFDHAALAIGIGYIMDGLDGRVARLTGTTSDFGVQLDSLADVLTFGIAPATLAFSWGLSSTGSTPIEQHVRSLGWIATFMFVMCGALRLARFNIQTQKPPEASSKRYFVGLPIPAGAGLIASIVHFSSTSGAPIQSVPLLWFLLVFATALLMVSTVRYYSFKDLDIMYRSPRWALVAVAMMIGLIFFWSAITLLCLAVVYVASGPVAKLGQLVRRWLPANVAPNETAHGNIKT